MLSKISNESAQPVSFEEWVNHVDRFNEIYEDHWPKRHVSVDCAKYLAPVVHGFMRDPVGLVGGVHPITAMIQELTDIREFKEYLNNLNSQIYLYMPIWVSGSYQFEPPIALRGSQIPSPDEYPVVTNPYWVVRYATLDN